jgi:hypothetical protein
MQAANSPSSNWKIRPRAERRVMRRTLLVSALENLVYNSRFMQSAGLLRDRPRLPS